MKHTARLSFLAAAAVTSFSFYQAPAPVFAQADAPVAVTIPIGDWVGYTPWLVAKGMGFDLDHGVQIVPVRIATGSDVTAALAVGQISSAHTNIPITTQRQAAGIDHKLVLFMGFSVTGDALIAGEGIDSIEDLVGRRIALVRDSQREYLLRLALREAGLGMDDVQIVDVNTDELAGLAFTTGEVDAAMTYEPYIGRSLSINPDAKIIVSAGEFPGSISDSWVVSTRFLEDYPDAVVGMIRAWDDAVKFLRENPDDAFEVIVSQSGLTLENLQETYTTITLFDITESLAFMQNDLVPMADEIVGIMSQFGTLRAEHDFEDALDIGPIERAVAQLD